MSAMLTLLRNTTLYAPEPLGSQDLLFGGGKVLAIAPRLPDPPAEWPVQVLDAQGARLVPGLVDCHAHLTGGGGEGGAHTRVPAPGLTELTLSGVTTAIGLLGTDCTTRSLAELLATARGLSHYGPTCLVYTGGYEVPPPTLTGSVRGDIVHIDRVVAVGELAVSDHRSSQPTLDELLRVAADAHVSGLMTGKAGLLHLHLGDGARGLSLVREAITRSELPARVFHPTHCNRNRPLWKEAMDLSALGGFIDISAFPADGDAPSGAQALLQWAQRGLNPHRVTLSSDSGGCLPDFDAEGNLLGMGVGSARSLLSTLREAVALGLPLERALAACTQNVATLFRLHHKGHIAPGADADLLLLNEDMTVRSLWADGRHLVQDGQALVRDLFGR